MQGQQSGLAGMNKPLGEEDGRCCGDRLALSHGSSTAVSVQPQTHRCIPSTFGCLRFRPWLVGSRSSSLAASCIILQLRLGNRIGERETCLSSLIATNTEMTAQFLPLCSRCPILSRTHFPAEHQAWKLFSILIRTLEINANDAHLGRVVPELEDVK